jgi:hypothetical protein
VPHGRTRFPSSAAEGPPGFPYSAIRMIRSVHQPHGSGFSPALQTRVLERRRPTRQAELLAVGELLDLAAVQQRHTAPLHDEDVACQAAPFQQPVSPGVAGVRPPDPQAYPDGDPRAGTRARRPYAQRPRSGSRGAAERRWSPRRSPEHDDIANLSRAYVRSKGRASWTPTSLMPFSAMRLFS